MQAVARRYIASFEWKSNRNKKKLITGRTDAKLSHFSECFKAEVRAGRKAIDQHPGAEGNFLQG
jgi:hypothetical protein